MYVTYLLYNPLAGRITPTTIEALTSTLTGEVVALDMTQLKNYEEFFGSLSENDKVIICGGDGTLNRFVNDTADISIPQEIEYYAAGNGNDFMRDILGTAEARPVPINAFLHNLPVVSVNGQNYRFLNGVGYGIDGYCCEEGDRLRTSTRKKVNYAGIAVKGLLFHYKPTSADITVDGITHHYDKVWLAPTMAGHYYGGGMMPTPAQDRLNKEHTVSVMVMYGTGKLHTLRIFPSIFKGEHIKHQHSVEVLTGNEITVQFDCPTPLQIDGETICHVWEYHVSTAPAV